MKLRWYQTYDKHGVNSEITLQYRESEDDEWEDVIFFRERESNYLDEDEE